MNVQRSRFDFMASTKKQSQNISELLEQLDQDRSVLLKQIDLGRWPELRPDLAALERELGQLLSRATDVIEEQKDFNKSN